MGRTFMQQKGRIIQLSLQSIIRDEENEEVNRFRETGTFYYRKGKDILFYDEKSENDALIHHFVTIDPANVSIKRSGAISMHQTFQEQRKTETYYKHMFGSFYMETYTHSIFHQSLNEHAVGRLEIHYNVRLNQTIEREHILKITYQ